MRLCTGVFMTGATLIFLILSMVSGSDIYIGTAVFLCHSRAIYGKVFSITLACSGVAGKYWKTDSFEYLLWPVYLCQNDRTSSRLIKIPPSVLDISVIRW